MTDAVRTTSLPAASPIQPRKTRRRMALHRAFLALLLVGMAAPLGGCVVYPARPYAAARWVPGHYGPRGYWIRGHWI
ncbi:MAG TPA: hypothetical protein VMU82_10120 [Acetobacteraceae bacterium]|nr:hypothetical protein [Acetobacteraceae bacterium]